MSGDMIEQRDVPGMLDTKEGMIRAYGILWATWSEANTAASIARHVLLAELSKEDQATGIAWANKALDRDVAPDPLSEAFNSGDGSYRP